MGILNETIGGVPVSTLVIGMAIVLAIVWLWSRWDERKARKRRAKRAEYQASIQDHTRVRTRVMEEAKKFFRKPGCQLLARTMIETAAWTYRE